MQYELFIGAAKRLDDIDIPRIGSRIGVGEDEIHAFMEVEAGSSGFDSQGRPKMLFEPHIFYRNLSGDQRIAAIEQGLAYRKWGTEGYPVDSYPRLKEAIEINENAALMSASWGLGQILGTNYRAAGYATIQDMIVSFMADEENHLNAMVNFIIANGIDDDIRDHRWETVARVYNGPGYAKHGYHTRLAAAYRKWSRIMDTPWEGSPDPVDKAQSYPTVRIGSSGWVVKHLQEELKSLGYHSGATDSEFGRATRASVLAFQADHRLKTDGVAGPETWDVLENSAQHMPVSDARANATVETLRDKGSETVADADRGTVGAGIVAGVGGLAGVDAILDNVDRANGALGRVQEVLGDFSGMMTDIWPIVFLAGGAAAVWYFHKVKKDRVKDHRSGANMSR
tara:strand:- start:1615 stop:2805 length:1191 start_codon:yes stop_codon:yes gene_type:complete